MGLAASFLVGAMIWVGSTWLIGAVLPGNRQVPLWIVLPLTAFAYAPLVLSVLIIIPYVGSGIEAVLNTWTLLALVVGVMVAFEVGFVYALVCAGLGWGITRLLPRLAGGRMNLLFENAWYRVNSSQRACRKRARGRRDHRTFAQLMILSTVWVLLLIAVGILVVLALLSPLESLRWWAGWSEEEASRPPPEVPMPEAEPHAANPRYLVWLSGIGSVPGETEDPLEVRFLNELRERVPNAVIVDDAFAYSVRDNPLAGKRVVDSVWRSARKDLEAGKPNVALGTLIQLRNAMQVAVSADGRYGPIYNLGLAQAIVKRLTARGYVLDSGNTGHPHRLQRWRASVCRRGALSQDVAQRAHLGHFNRRRDRRRPRLAVHRAPLPSAGRKDPFPAFGTVLFVGRWPVIKYSHWNKASRRRAR